MAKPQIQSEPKPPFPAKKLEKPGLESELEPRPRYQAPRYRPAGKLEGKVALITGGDSGIGRAVAVMCANRKDSIEDVSDTSLCVGRRRISRVPNSAARSIRISRDSRTIRPNSHAGRNRFGCLSNCTTTADTVDARRSRGTICYRVLRETTVCSVVALFDERQLLL